MADRILVDRGDGVATVTVNRSEKRNAMDVPTRKDLRAAFESVGEDDAVRAVVLRGAGDGSFIAGGDIDSFAEFDHMEGLEYATKYAQGLYNYVADLPKPTVAAVDGYALGGGTEIALACDIRLATEDAKFGLPDGQHWCPPRWRRDTASHTHRWTHPMLRWGTCPLSWKGINCPFRTTSSAMVRISNALAAALAASMNGMIGPA